MSQAKSATTAARTLLAQQKDNETKEAAKKNETIAELGENAAATKEKAETEKLVCTFFVPYSLIAVEFSEFWPFVMGSFG